MMYLCWVHYGGIAMAKHLTDENRLQIEHWLKERISINQIATRLGRNSSTISREIRKHALPSSKSAHGRMPNRCIHARTCDKRFLCEEKPNCTRLCRHCNLCNRLCPDYKEHVCHRLASPPYVCNGCEDEHRCVLRKRYYLHRTAHQAYRETLVEARTGANLSEEQLLELDLWISPLVKNGQSLHHIVVHRSDELTVSEKSLYRYVAGGLFKARNIDMPRVCRLKPRRSKPVEHKVDTACRIGRTYQAYQSFLQENRDLAVVEMDSVIGRIGGKVLLTFMFKSCDFMLAFIRDRNTSQSVIDVFNWIQSQVGGTTFRAMFPVLLTDNGSEFSNPAALELDEDRLPRTKIFYCDPCASYQKPNVELNHEFIRRILPAGKSFDALTQADVNFMMSHINSYTREKLNDKSPLELFSFLYGLDTLEKLGHFHIPANEIVLRPSLLK